MSRVVRGSVPEWVRTAHTFLNARAQAAMADGTKAPLSKALKALIAKEGEETPEGHLEMRFPNPITIGGVEYLGLRNQRSNPQPELDEERAEELLEELGLRDKVIKTVEVEVADWEQLYVLNQEGKITDDQLDSLFDTPDPTYSLVVIKP